MKREKNSFGFSLVELMIVVAALGGISLVVMNLTKQSTKSSAKYQFDSEINLITSEINAILSNPAVCKTTFGANNLTPTNINGKYYTTASGSAPANGYGNAGTKITSYTLVHSTLPGATANDGVLTILFQNKAIVGGSTTPRNINVYYEGAISAITQCRSLSTSTTDIWSHGAGTDIFYSTGNVGIGTAAPARKFEISAGHVDSQMRIFSSGDGGANTGILNFWSSEPLVTYTGVGMGNNIRSYDGSAAFKRENTTRGGSYMRLLDNAISFYLVNSSGVETNPVFLSPGGNVGVGTISPAAKLEIAGGLKVGDQTQVTVCDAASEGTQRYNKALHAMEYCGASGSPLVYAWTEMGGSGGGGTAGMYAYFNASACPSGWVPANGTGGTLDLRGEFIRSWDNGRGVDAGRALGAFQDATGIDDQVYQTVVLFHDNIDGPLYAASWYNDAPGANGFGRTHYRFKVRPRNISLLACMKS